MDRHRRVEIGLLRAHLDRDGERLDRLARRVAEDVRAHDPVGRRVDDELHQRALGAARNRRLHRPEIGLVDVDDRETLGRLGLGEPDRADLRGGEHRVGDEVVIDAPLGPAEQPIGERMAVADRHRRQVHAVGHVADRVDRGDAGGRMAIDDDRPRRVEGDARHFEPQAPCSACARSPREPDRPRSDRRRRARRRGSRRAFRSPSAGSRTAARRRRASVRRAGLRACPRRSPCSTLPARMTSTTSAPSRANKEANSTAI